MIEQSKNSNCNSPHFSEYNCHSDQLRIAILLPCYNEEFCIGKVVQSFCDALPNANIYVYDNSSQDATARIAREAGATVGHEMLQGKGHVVRRMFADIDSDIYVLADGDDTYHAQSAPDMVRRLIDKQLDMVTGVRVANDSMAYRRGHRFGNWALTNLVAKIFGNRVRDMLSGYRVMTRRFVKSFPALSTGFEIETELTVHALQLNMPIAEMETPYKERPEGSSTKLRTYRDGFLILKTIVTLIKEERPLQFFSATGFLLGCSTVALAMPILETYAQTGLVPRLPTAILATGMALMAFLSLACGLILNTVTRGRREIKRLFYLSIPALQAKLGAPRSPLD